MELYKKGESLEYQNGNIFQFLNGFVGKSLDSICQISADEENYVWRKQMKQTDRNSFPISIK